MIYDITAHLHSLQEHVITLCKREHEIMIHYATCNIVINGDSIKEKRSWVEKKYCKHYKEMDFEGQNTFKDMTENKYPVATWGPS